MGTAEEAMQQSVDTAPNVRDTTIGATGDETDTLLSTGGETSAANGSAAENESALLGHDGSAEETLEPNDGAIRVNIPIEPDLVEPSTATADRMNVSTSPESTLMVVVSPTTNKRSSAIEEKTVAEASPVDQVESLHAISIQPTPKVDITRPVKRARTAYFVFAEERRAQVQQQHPGEGVATVARSLGHLWNALTPDEKIPYQQQAAIEREQVAAATEAWRNSAGSNLVNAIGVDADVNLNGGTKDPSQLIFPIARIRKICKLDPDVRGLSKEAILLITKVAELATAKLGVECVRMATIQNRRKLLPEDVAQVCETREQFMFLREDIVDLTRAQLKESAANGTKSSTSHGKGYKENTVAAKNGKRLTDYFKTAS